MQFSYLKCLCLGLLIFPFIQSFAQNAFDISDLVYNPDNNYSIDDVASVEGTFVIHFDGIIYKVNDPDITLTLQSGQLSDSITLSGDSLLISLNDIVSAKTQGDVLSIYNQAADSIKSIIEIEVADEATSLTSTFSDKEFLAFFVAVQYVPNGSSSSDDTYSPIGPNARVYWKTSEEEAKKLQEENADLVNSAPSSDDIPSTDTIPTSDPPAVTSSDTIQIFSISTRAYFGPNGMSGSLNMEGNNNDPKKVMFRVKGPSMNISGTKLANPSMDVKSKSVSATTWTDEFVSKNFGDHSSATGPYKDRNTGNDLEPMVVTSFTPNVYGCVVGSENGGEGNAIIEIYSLDDDSSSSYFTSLSTRGYYGANGMSGSVNLVGTGKMKVMFRVKGPSMNISGTKLADPNLTLYHSVPNEDTADPDDTKWSQVVQSSTFLSYTGENTSYTNLTSSYTDRHTGNNLEPMVVYELSEGIYGCVVGSDNNGQGNAIIEIYSLE